MNMFIRFILLKCNDLLKYLISGYKRRIIKYSVPHCESRHFSSTLNIKYPKNLITGTNVKIGDNVTLGAMSEIYIGDNVTISQDAILETAGLSKSNKRHQSKPITIHDGVWIGARAIILGGVTVGKNATIAAGAVIRKDVNEGQTIF